MRRASMPLARSEAIREAPTRVSWSIGDSRSRETS